MENRPEIDWHRLVADIRGERDYWREAYEDLFRTAERIYKEGYHQGWTDCYDRMKELEAERIQIIKGDFL